MDIGLVVQYRLCISAAELRLMSKALRGELSDAERGEALELQEKMMLERAKQARQLLGEFEKTEQAIARKASAP